MPREIDEAKKRRALRKLRRAREEAKARGEDLSDWETEFMQSVEGRLERFGSAFADPEKGDLSEPLSGRQRVKLNEVAKKAKGRSKAGDAPDAPKARKPMKARKPPKARKPMSRGKGFGAKAGKTGPRVRDISDDLQDGAEADARPAGPPVLRVIDGGQDES